MAGGKHMARNRGLPVRHSREKGGSRFRSALPLAALALMLAAAGCGSATKTGGSGGGSSGSTSELKVGMVLPGPKNDKSFSQASYEGILKAEKEHGIKAQIRENVVDPTARLEALRDLAQSNNVVMAASAAFAEAGGEVAPQFPKVTFIILNGQKSDASNLYAYALREGVPAYIAGLVAGKTTKSGKVGFVGGEEIPSTLQAQKGFKAGAEASGKPVQVQGTIIGSFNDVEKARLSAAAQIKDGVDYIYSHLDAAVAGVIRAFEQSGSQGGTFNIIAPRCEKHVIGASIADVAALISSMVGDYKNKTLPAERQKLVGVENPAVQRFELCPDYKTPELQKLVDDTTKGINDGTIKLVEGI